MSHYIEDAVLYNTVSKTTAETMSTMEELDKLATALARKIDREVKHILEDNGRGQPDKVLLMRQVLEDLTERKTQLAIRCYDLVDHHIHLVDQQMSTLETAIRLHGKDIILQDSTPDVNTVGSSSGASRSGRPGRKKSQANAELEAMNAPPQGPIDPSEPLYCLCRQTAYGNMIACDNDDCPTEWFHYGCVNLTKKPKNEWLCPSCSQEKGKRK